MEIKTLEKSDNIYWQKTIDFAYANISNAQSNIIYNAMKNDTFDDWQRIFIATIDDNIAGFASFTKKDYCQTDKYAHWISNVFVSEIYRGNRISEKIISNIILYAKRLNFENLYLQTSHENLYEKYGFTHIDTLENFDGNMDKIYNLCLVSN